MPIKPQYDVAILGAGLAGLTLARQLVLTSNKRILLVERRPEIPPKKQKVGESTVQVGGYYLGKVLDLEEYLLHDQLMKYNLRFYWRTPGRKNDQFEDFGQAYLRQISNIPCYQLDRNTLEGELARLARASDRIDFVLGTSDLKVDLSEAGDHDVSFKAAGALEKCKANWVVDASGRASFLKQRLSLEQKNDVRHGTSYFWVDGLVNLEKLTDRTPREQRLNPDRRQTGHLPQWLATNHFVGEGFWFWVIPLQHKTSFGLVYDTKLIPHDKVSTPQRLLAWLFKEFPLFERELKDRPILDCGSFRDFSYSAQQTLGKNRWALTGESGRFSDPLYSPGSDLIALHNSLITHAITKLQPSDYEAHQFLYELLMRSLYDAFLPTYDTSYDCLGDQECFVLKYGWELSIYFSFFVMPFVNELFPQQGFILPFLERFSTLGTLNRRLHEFLSGYYQWKKREGREHAGPIFHELSSLGTLKESEQLFYQVGVGTPEALRLLDTQLESLRELARFTVAHVTAMVVSDPQLLTHKDFVDGIHLDQIQFDPKAMKERHRSLPAARETYAWKLDPNALKAFWSPVIAARMRPTG
jgi:2-polyprenyl-6-methoxyphenol hydroxylase-like FAD-dependent oxidoreductase